MSGADGERRRVRVAEAMLLITTAVWGVSFALAKESGDAINRAAGDSRALGPIFVLAMRFTLGAICVATAMAWLARRRERSLSRDPGDASSALDAGPERSAGPAFDARAGPALRSGPAYGPSQGALRDAAILGALLAVSAVVQHLALERTSEATAAFLTSLAVVFVPMTLWIALGQRPSPAAWVGVALAVPGVWLMSGASGIAIGAGEALGIACAVGFAWHLLAVGRYAPRLGALRACLAQFAGVAILCWPLTFLLLASADEFDARVLARPAVWGNVLLLLAGPTLVSFGLMAAFQPRVAPVRAALIYLLEPPFAAAFAWLWTGRPMTRGEWLGGGLILLANAIVEAWPRRSDPLSPVPGGEGQGEGVAARGT